MKKKSFILYSITNHEVATSSTLLESNMKRNIQKVTEIFRKILPWSELQPGKLLVDSTFCHKVTETTKTRKHAKNLNTHVQSASFLRKAALCFKVSAGNTGIYLIYFIIYLT